MKTKIDSEQKSDLFRFSFEPESDRSSLTRDFQATETKNWEIQKRTFFLLFLLSSLPASENPLLSLSSTSIGQAWWRPLYAGLFMCMRKNEREREGEREGKGRKWVSISFLWLRVKKDSLCRVCKHVYKKCVLCVRACVQMRMRECTQPQFLNLLQTILTALSFWL